MKPILTFVLLLFAHSLIAQSNEIKVKFIGNCGIHLSDGKSNIFFDFPYVSGAYNYMEYSKAALDSVPENSIFFFTHRHRDHYSRKLWKKLDGEKIDPWNISDIEKVTDSVSDFEIQTFRTSHKVFGISFRHYSYLITWHGKKIYISGDTGDFEHLKDLKNIDWAFVNPWLYQNAIQAKMRIDSKMFGLYHLYPNQKIDGEIPDYIVILKNEGELIKIGY